MRHRIHDILGVLCVPRKMFDSRFLSLPLIGSVCDENCKCQTGGSYDGGVAVNKDGYCEFHCSSSGYCGDSNSYKTLGSRDCTACGA